MAKHKKKITQHVAGLLVCAVAAAALFFSSCKKKEIPQAKSTGGGTFSLSSTGFTDGGEIPQRYANSNNYANSNSYTRWGSNDSDDEVENDEIERSNISPQLSWKNAPEGTTSFFIIMEKSLDDDGLDCWNHSCWYVYNIRANQTSLSEGDTSIHKNSNYYNGPKAPIGEINTCQITIYALDLPADHFGGCFSGNRPPFSKAEAEKRLKGHILASASITGTFTGK